MDAASATSYADLERAHLADYRDLFDRVRLDLGGRVPRRADRRVRRRCTGGPSPDDRALEAMFFAYGRHVLISSSRAGETLPANLQGGWNDSTSPPWSGAFHVNINLQMTTGPARRS